MEQHNLRRRLMATARSLKKQKQRLKAAQDTLNRRWNKVLDIEGKYGDDRHTKSYPKRKLLPKFDDEAASPIPPKNNTSIRPDQPLHGRDRAATDAAHDLCELLDKRPARPGPSTDPEDMLRRGIMVTKMIRPIEYQFGINTRCNNSRQHAMTCPDTEGLCTLCASPTRCWIMNFHRDSNP